MTMGSGKCKLLSLATLAFQTFIKSLSGSYTVRWLCCTSQTVGNYASIAQKQQWCEVLLSHMEKKWWSKFTSIVDAAVAYFSELLQTVAVGRALLRRAITSALPATSSHLHLLLQLFLSDTVVLQASHVDLAVLLATANFKFDDINSLISNECCLNYDLLNLCLPMLPKLTVLKAVVSDKLSSLGAIRDHCCSLEALSLPELRLTVTDNDSMSRVLFRGTSLSSVVRQFTRGEPVPLSFPKLKYLALPFHFPTCLPCFRMLIFYYTTCHFEWEFFKDDLIPVSIFDAALCPAMSLYPDHELNHCELRFEDLRFSYVDEVLANWTNLRSLRLVLGKSSVDLRRAHLKLRAILLRCQGLENLQICVTHKQHERSLATVRAVCGQHGGRVRQLSLVDCCSGWPLEQMLALLICFSSLSCLTLVFSSKNSFEEQHVKLKVLKTLEKIKFDINDAITCADHMRSFSVFVGDILKKCPNIRDLSTPMEDHVLRMLQQLQINSQLHFLTLYLCSMLVEMNFVSRLYKYIETMSLKELTVESFGNLEPTTPLLSERFSEGMRRALRARGIAVAPRSLTLNSW